MTPSAENRPPAGRRVRVAAHESTPLASGWEAAALQAGAEGAPAPATAWIPAEVPGTAAGALQRAGLWEPGGRDLDAEEWIFRTSFAAEASREGERLLLRMDGLATVCEVSLNGEVVHASDSMFAPALIDVGPRVREDNELLVRCRALTPLLAGTRRPRARWRTQLVAERNLRFLRTMLIGRIPGVAPGPAVVGPWRPVALERRRGCDVERLQLRAAVHDGDGILEASALVQGLGGHAPEAVRLELSGPTGTHAVDAELEPAPGRPDGRVARARLRVPGPALWWPHTHGEPALYDLALTVAAGGEQHTVDAGRVGFRTITFGGREASAAGIDGDVDIAVNGVPVFARGAVWTPLDLFAPSVAEQRLRHKLEIVRASGMNMLRLPGTGAYESADFHDLCDELGILVWQDLMFANFDYPFADESFRSACEQEIGAELAALSGRPSLAVVCGNSEVEQQATMLGISPEMARENFFYETAPAAAAAHAADALYVPSAPSGGELPFRPDARVSNYYGVGAYRRPLSDARTSGVRFAAESLAFANVPASSDEDRLDPALERAGTPRDRDADWDFADVRDHYLQVLYDVDPDTLRRTDPACYARLSRAVSGEVMAEVFGEWRRPSSTCRGGLVLWMKDLEHGAGWGLLDLAGRPKPALHLLARVLTPTALWLVDEGLGGIVAHAANDGPKPFSGELRVSLYRDFEQRVDEARVAVELPAHGAAEWNIETLLGRFADVSWAYRFGPPAQDLIVAELTGDGSPIPQALRFPAGRPPVQPASELGLQGEVLALADGALQLDLRTRRLTHGVCIRCRGFDAEEELFSIEPGASRRIRLLPRHEDADGGPVRVTALNLAGHLDVAEAKGNGAT